MYDGPDEVLAGVPIARGCRCVCIQYIVYKRLVMCGGSEVIIVCRLIVSIYISCTTSSLSSQLGGGGFETPMWFYGGHPLDVGVAARGPLGCL